MNECWEISRKCPKCQKDYSADPYWKSSLKKHLARKNPCDRNKATEPYVRKRGAPRNVRALKFTKEVYEYAAWLNWVRSQGKSSSSAAITTTCSMVTLQEGAPSAPGDPALVGPENPGAFAE